MVLSAHKAYNSAWCCTSNKNPVRPLMEDLEPLFKFPIHLSVRNFRENYRQIMENLKQASGEI